MVQDTPSRKLDQYIVRFPDGMRNRLKDAAVANKRSLNAEIVARLEASLAKPLPLSDIEKSLRPLSASRTREETITDIRYNIDLLANQIDALRAVVKKPGKR